MRGNIVLASTIAGLSAVLACVVLVVGLRWALVGGADRLNEAIDRHADRIAVHARAVEHAGQTISQPSVKMLGPVPITDDAPLRIRGMRTDDSVPVDVKLEGKPK
jgi:hypothetical protein